MRRMAIIGHQGRDLGPHHDGGLTCWVVLAQRLYGNAHPAAMVEGLLTYVVFHWNDLEHIS